ncbi:MAG: hypothetical protein HY791_34450 [Deltaproteobacteria bacterium]|nr:hypothetical protein [Deltaproteobacteria bacterium]
MDPRPTVHNGLVAVSITRVAVLCLLGAGCGAQARVDDASLSLFQESALPVLLERCALRRCHGLDASSYEQEAKRRPGELWLPMSDATDPSPAALARSVFEVVRSRPDRGGGRIAYGDSPDASPLLRHTIPVELGGSPHRGVSVFSETREEGYQRLRDWVRFEVETHREDKSARTPAEELFGSRVVPVLERNGCFFRACHGEDAFNDLKLVAPTPDDALAAQPGPESTQAVSLGSRQETRLAFDERSRLDALAASHTGRGPDLARGGIQLRKTIERWFAADSHSAVDFDTLFTRRELIPAERPEDREARFRRFIGISSGPDAKKSIAPRYSGRAVARLREQALGALTRFANLGGDLALSRLIAKNLPISRGGVHHRGGNLQFFESLDDPDVATLLEWMSLERAEVAERLTSRGRPIDPEALGRLDGVAFIRAPRHSPRRWFDLDTFWSGSDVFVQPLNDSFPARNVTEFLHPAGPVEIQAFDVRYDARAIVLSMRSSPDEGFRLYEIELDDDLRPVSARRLTHGPRHTPSGVLVHHIDPIYLPGERSERLDDVAVAFASNAGGECGPSEPEALVGESDDGDTQSFIDVERAESAHSLEGRSLLFVGGPNRGESRRIVRHVGVDSGPGSRFVLDQDLPRPIGRSEYAIEAHDLARRGTFDIWRLTLPDAEELPEPRRMTFGPGQDRRPTLRTSGEVMFTSVRNGGWQADRPVYNGAIYRVQAGGFDYHIHAGNRSRYPLYSDARELPSGLEVRLLHDPRGLWGAGVLAVADHGLGPNLETENPMDSALVPRSNPRATPTGLTRFLPTQLPLLPETGPSAVTHAGWSPGGAFRDPFPLPDGRILVSFARGPLNHLGSKDDPDFDILIVEFPVSSASEDPSRGGQFAALPVSAATSTLSELNARPIMVRLPERSETHQKFRADLAQRPQREDGALRVQSGTPGVIECYDFPLLASFLTFFAPVGSRQLGFAPPSEELAYVRIIADRPSRTCEILEPSEPMGTSYGLSAQGPQEIVAELPLEVDGSFFAEVPSETPLRLQALNSRKMAVMSMSRRFYLHPGEKLTFSIPRSLFPLRCGGCHGSLTGRPEDLLGPPDVVTAASRVAANFGRAPRPPAATWSLRSPDFERDIRNILRRRCVHCHDGSITLDLRDRRTGRYSSAYEALLRPSGRYVDDRGTRSAASFLIETLVGQEILAEARLSGAPDHSSHLDEGELDMMIRWIDLGAPFRAPLSASERP